MQCLHPNDSLSVSADLPKIVETRQSSCVTCAPRLVMSVQIFWYIFLSHFLSIFFVHFFINFFCPFLCRRIFFFFGWEVGGGGWGAGYPSSDKIQTPPPLKIIEKKFGEIFGTPPPHPMAWYSAHYRVH